MTTKELEDFIERRIMGNDICDADNELRKMFKSVDCYDEDIDDKTADGEYIMYKGFNCETDEEFYDVILYYCGFEVTDYEIR